MERHSNSDLHLKRLFSKSEAPKMNIPWVMYLNRDSEVILQSQKVL